LSDGGRLLAVSEVFDTGEYESVYNFRVADHHTYFVGDEGWGWRVWSHNNCAHELRVIASYGGTRLSQNVRNFRSAFTKTGRRIADHVIDGTGIEAKYVTNWAKSIYNPLSKVGKMPFAADVRRKIVEQATDYLSEFKFLHLHSNSDDFLAAYRNVFASAGLDLSKIRFIITK
jgi:hypothetical protein